MSGLFLGIDTSNYKTSAALVSAELSSVYERSEFLEVPDGSRGLRQSEAFFRHSNRLPDYISEALDAAGSEKITAVGVSDRPRRVEGSYMPCFLPGVNAARIAAASLKVPVFTFSHQEGHAAAVLERSGIKSCILMHLSGGTTEFLRCERDEKGYAAEIIGGTKDISAGQLLDRAGVLLGYPFPSGRYLDEAAWSFFEEHGFDTSCEALPGIFPRVKLKDGFFNLSGAETKLLRYLETVKDDPKAVKAAFAELFADLADLLADAADNLSGASGIATVFMAGGCASSKTIRGLISARAHSSDIRFGDAGLSGDNAVGTAMLAARLYEKTK